MKWKRIDLLAVKFDAWDRNAFLEEAVSYSKNSMIFFFDFDKYCLEYKPENINFIRKVIKYVKFKNVWLNHAANPIFGLINIAIFMFLFGFLCLRYRPKVCWMDNTWPAVVTGLMKKLGICDYSIYTPSDWLVNNHKQNPIRYLANNVLWSTMDYLACRLNDNVLNLTREIGEARYKYWGRKVARREGIDFRHIKIKGDSINRNRNKICFLGRVQDDSGLDVVISTMREIWEEHGIMLKIVGPARPAFEKLKEVVKAYDAQEFVEISGFVEADKLYEFMSDCFCGIHLINSTNSHTIYTISGKLIQYIQLLMPVIVTKNIGPFHKLIQQYEIGKVIKPLRDEICSSVEHLYKNLEQYQENIRKFVSSMPVKKIKDYIL